MLILIHVALALSSIAATTVTAFLPSVRKIRACYVLIGLTLATGTYLVVSLHSPMLSACVSGLAYLAVAVSGLSVARFRLALQRRSLDQ